MASGAKPAGARLSVAPWMTIRKKSRQDEFRDHARRQRIPAGRMGAIAVRREAGGRVEAGFPAGDDVQDCASGEAPGHLGNHVRHDVLGREAAAGPQAERHGRIEMPPGNMAHPA